MEKKYRVKCRGCGGTTLRRTPASYLCSHCRNPFNMPLQWKRIRKAILKRDNNKCLLCGETKKLHVHHIDKNRKNNSDRNLMTLCDQCHESQHKKNFEKPIGFIFGKLGKRLIYQSDLEEIIHSARPQRVLKRKFFRKTAGKGGIKKKTL